MFSRDALRALREGNLSDLELSSDDDDGSGGISGQQSRSVRLGADTVNQNQREFYPEPEEDFDLELEGEMPESSTPLDVDQETGVLAAEIEESTIIFQNLTPKQRIRWRHRPLENTIESNWIAPIVANPTIEAPVDYFYRYVPKTLFHTMAEMTNLYAVQSSSSDAPTLGHASDLAVVQAFREYQMDNDLAGVPKKNS